MYIVIMNIVNYCCRYECKIGIWDLYEVEEKLRIKKPFSKSGCCKKDNQYKGLYVHAKNVQTRILHLDINY